MILLACVSFAVSLVFLWAARFQQGTVDDREMRMILAGAFGATGLVAVVLYLASLWARHIYSQRKSHSRRSFSNAGSVMVWVLVLTGLAASLLFGLMAGTRRISGEARAAGEFEELRLAAADTAMLLLRNLSRDPDLLTDHLGEDWAEPVEIEYPGGIRTVGTIIDAQSFFDVNNLTATRPVNVAQRTQVLLDNIMRECGVNHPARYIESLNDWVDEDGDGSYEASFYMSQREPYRPPDGPMQSLREFDWIDGWSLDKLTEQHDDHAPSIADLLAVIPVHRNEPIPVNINTASAELLTAIFGGDNVQLVNLIVSMRTSTPLRSVNLIENVVGADRMEYLRPFLDVKSNFFRVMIMAERDQRTFMLAALARRDASGDVSVLRWGY